MNATTSMAFREVRVRDWPEFCERLNQLEGEVASIELIDLEGMRTEIARNAELEGVSFGKLDACSDQICIRTRGNRLLQHSIIDPLHVKLEETQGGRGFDAVFMEGENGTTVLTVHPVIRESMLAGLQLR